MERKFTCFFYHTCKVVIVSHVDGYAFVCVIWKWIFAVLYCLQIEGIVIFSELCVTSLFRTLTT